MLKKLRENVGVDEKSAYVIYEWPQRQMVGTYWKGFNIFSLCDYDQCNHGARNMGGLSLFSSMILLLVHKLF